MVCRGTSGEAVTIHSSGTPLLFVVHPLPGVNFLVSRTIPAYTCPIFHLIMAVPFTSACQTMS